MSNKPIGRSIALAAALALSGGAQAALTAFTSQASFLGSVSSYGVDTFAGFATNAATTGPLTRSAGAFGYTATATSPLFYGAGSAADPWLSTETAEDSITFSDFSGSASAIGGLFFGSDIDGAFAVGDIKLTVTDSLGATLSQTLTGATLLTFAGFKSTGTITSLVVTAAQPADGFLWPTVDNLTIGVSAVPEPASYALLLAGFGVVTWVARRRRS